MKPIGWIKKEWGIKTHTHTHSYRHTLSQQQQQYRRVHTYNEISTHHPSPLKPAQIARWHFRCSFCEIVFDAQHHSNIYILCCAKEKLSIDQYNNTTNLIADFIWFVINLSNVLHKNHSFYRICDIDGPTFCHVKFYHRFEFDDLIEFDCIRSKLFHTIRIPQI